MAAPNSSSLPADVPDHVLPPVVVPGQVRASAVGESCGGVDPGAALHASAKARAAWMPLNSAELALPAAVAGRSTGAQVAAVKAVDPISTAGLAAAGKGHSRQGGIAQSYDREAVMSRLEREGRKDAKPICSDC